MSALQRIVVPDAAESMPTRTANAPGPIQECLIFPLRSKECGIDVLKAQEIRPFETATWLANALTFAKELVKFRGVVVPVVDLRIKLVLAKPNDDASTAVMILNVAK